MRSPISCSASAELEFPSNTGSSAGTTCATHLAIHRNRVTSATIESRQRKCRSSTRRGPPQQLPYLLPSPPRCSQGVFSPTLPATIEQSRPAVHYLVNCVPYLPIQSRSLGTGTRRFQAFFVDGLRSTFAIAVGRNVIPTVTWDTVITAKLFDDSGSLIKTDSVTIKASEKTGVRFFTSRSRNISSFQLQLPTQTLHQPFS